MAEQKRIWDNFKEIGEVQKSRKQAKSLVTGVWKNVHCM